MNKFQAPSYKKLPSTRDKRLKNMLVFFIGYIIILMILFGWISN